MSLSVSLNFILLFSVLISDFNEVDEVEHLRASVDFLVELCDTFSPV